MAGESAFWFFLTECTRQGGSAEYTNKTRTEFGSQLGREWACEECCSTCRGGAVATQVMSKS